MNRDEIFSLYNKEREYQTTVFKENPTFNVATFISFLQVYIDKAQDSYVNRWTSILPSWLLSCDESKKQQTAPVETYGYLIKIMALAGAALERFTEINFEEWRSEGVKEKWMRE